MCRGIVRHSLALAVLIGVMVATSRAQLPEDNGPTVTAVRSRLTNFFESLIEGRTPEAFKDLLTGSPLARPDRQTHREQLIKKTTDLEMAYGRPLGYEPLVVKKVGADLVVCRYLYKCENFPVVWHIVFYRELRESRSAEKPAGYDNWRVISIRFDTDLEALLR